MTSQTGPDSLEGRARELWGERPFMRLWTSRLLPKIPKLPIAGDRSVRPPRRRALQFPRGGVHQGILSQHRGRSRVVDRAAEGDRRLDERVRGLPDRLRDR